jgi:hypothetical protein
MKVYYEQSGGIAGVDIKTMINSNLLTFSEKNELHQLITNSHFFSIGSKPELPKGADRINYQIIVELDQGEAPGKTHKHTVKFYDPIPATLKPLVKYLKNKFLEKTT